VLSKIEIKINIKAMKNRSLAFVVFLVGMGLTVSAASAQTSASSSTVQNVTVATVNVQNARITSQSGNQLSLAFNVTNRTGTQPEIKYGVLVLQQGANGQVTTVDEKTYDQVISLNGNGAAFEEITYTPPAYLSGKYTVMIVAENPEGLLLGETAAGTATFTGSSQYLEVIPNSCYLTVTDDATSTHYTLTQGVDILPSEHLVLNCSVQNNLGSSVVVTPVLKTYYRSVFGMLVATSTLSSMTIPPQEAPVTETFGVPTVANPQAYDAVFMLAGPGEASSSNSIVLHYVVQGESATVQNVVFDKNSYTSGDTAQLSVAWTGTAGDFVGSRIVPTSTGAIAMTVTVEGGNNASCGAPVTQTIPQNQVSANLSIPITANCPTPKAFVTLADSSGSILAQTYFSTGIPTPQLTTASSATQSASSSGNAELNLVLIVILILLVIIGIVYFFIRRSKGGTPPDRGTMTKVIFFLAAMSVGMLGMHSAKADSIIVTTQSPEAQYSNGQYVGQYDFQVEYDFNVDQSVYPPGGTLTATVTASGASCDNGGYSPVTENITATVNGATKSLISGVVALLSTGQATFNVESTPGMYNAQFDVPDATAVLDHYTIEQRAVTDSIPYTVMAGFTPSTSTPSSPGSSTSGGSGVPSGPAALPPVCTFTSNPSHIVIPESSYLSYSCQNVTACDLSGGQFGAYPGVAVTVDPTAHTASSTQAVTPPMDTTYELDCSNTGSGVSYSNELQTYVIVDSPDLIEIAPH
jgi:hypothetical protein